MQDTKAYWNELVASKKPGELLDPDVRARFYDRAGHNLQFFTFHPSTPSAVVSSEMRTAFFECVTQGQTLPIVSSAGIRSALDVRVLDSEFSAFLRNIPVFPEELLNRSRSMVAALRARGMLEDITFADVLKELRGRPLSSDEMVTCLKWWISTSEQNPTGIDHTRRELLSAAVLTVGSSDSGDERTIPLQGIRTFIDPQNNVIPTEGPLPDHLLPIGAIPKSDLIQLHSSLQWTELSVLEWVQHIVDPAVYTQESNFNIVESPTWADRVLQVLSKSWVILSEVDQAKIISLLHNLTCVPTSSGMKLPTEAHFSDPGIFHGLPVVTLPSGTKIGDDLERVLADLGVQRHANLQVVFRR